VWDALPGVAKGGKTRRQNNMATQLSEGRKKEKIIIAGPKERKFRKEISEKRGPPNEVKGHGPAAILTPIKKKNQRITPQPTPEPTFQKNVPKPQKPTRKKTKNNALPLLLPAKKDTLKIAKGGNPAQLNKTRIMASGKITSTKKVRKGGGGGRLRENQKRMSKSRASKKKQGFCGKEERDFKCKRKFGVCNPWEEFVGGKLG